MDQPPELIAPAAEPAEISEKPRRKRQRDPYAERVVSEYLPELNFELAYACTWYEWEDGKVIRLSPGTLRHNDTLTLVENLLNAYFSLKPVGRTLDSPFMLNMKVLKRKREPDLMILLDDTPRDMTETMISTPPDICIEVVSTESITRDYIKKFSEYEAFGVGEYWILDPLRSATSFHRLNATGKYEQVFPNEDGDYQTPLLPGFRLPVATLWQKPLPNYIEVARLVEEMLRE